MKQAKVYMYTDFAGILTEDENGYTFAYDKQYLENKNAEAISRTMPISQTPYVSKILHPSCPGK